MKKKELAEYILSSLKKQGAEDAETRISDTVKTEIYYESGKISMVRTNFNTSISMKAVKDKKKGIISTNDSSTGNIDKCISDTMTALESAKPDDAEGICDVPANDVFSTGEKEPDLEHMYSGFKAFLSESREKYPAINFDSITVEHDCATTAYLNTNGTELETTRGFYVFAPTFMACRGDKSSSFNYAEALFTDIKKPLIDLGLVRMMLSDTEKQIETKSIEGKFTAPIIISPSCLGDFLGEIEGNFLSDGVLIDGTSIYKDSLGKKIASDCVTVWSSPRDSSLPGGSFLTNDGYIAENMPIIENGILKNFVLGRYGAKKTGKQRSSSSGGNYVMNAGSESLGELIKGIDKGLFVNRFSGGAPSTNGDFSGVAKNSFLIENGKITDAVSETMITGNLAELIKNISGISSERINNGDVILPWVKADGVVISGK